MGTDFSDALDTVYRAYPEAYVQVASLRMLDKEIDLYPPTPFFENVSVTISDEKWRATLLSVGAAELNSWTSHMASSMWCRLRTIEKPILENVALGNTLVGMILLRAHLEAAAMAAYCLEQVTKAARSNDFDQLAELIPKTLFGTSMLKHRDKESVAERLHSFETKTVDSICRAVDALDAFYYQEHAEGTLGIVYSLLCEFAHPNHRGVMDFMIAEDRPNGWEIVYGVQRPTPPKMALKALETLVVTMQGGYSASQMLSCWRFTEDADGTLRWNGPSREEADRIWQRVLQRPIPGSPSH
jgi:hypothetical protein